MATLAFRTPVGVRPMGRPATRRVMTVVRAAPASKDLNKNVQDAIKEAEDTCNEKGTKSKDCAVAWDNAEELLAEKAHKKAVEENDPLENFCKDAPDADECRMHEI